MYLKGVFVDANRSNMELIELKQVSFNSRSNQSWSVYFLGSFSNIILADNGNLKTEIINIFEQGDGDTIEFDTEGFTVKDCLINGKQHNFSEYLLNFGNFLDGYI